MPYKSKAQQAFMHIHHPEVAKEFDKATPKGEMKNLPEHVHDGTSHHNADGTIDSGKVKKMIAREHKKHTKK